MSILPWCIVCGLLAAGIFIKPTAHVEVVIPPAIEERDMIYGISSLNAEHLWLAGNYGKILFSDDNGNNWIRQVTSTRNHLQDISAWDENHIIAVGNKGVALVSDDGGDNWKEVATPKSDITNKLIRVHTYQGGEAWAVGEMGMIIFSADYGNTWQRMREEEDVIMNDIIKIDDENIIVVGEYGRIFRSIDRGQTWNDFYTDSPSSLTAIDFNSSTNGVAVGLDGVILVTNDTGETWALINKKLTGNTEHLMDVQWSEQLNEWVAIGNKGKWIKFSVSLSEYKADSFSRTDLSSHTELALVGDGLIAVGSNVGFYDFQTKAWQSLAD
ncbi:hypothetical protein A9Q98_06980 [Thalassotalea sp. 42_200_T64]|nr:hypothetical protein A9Q98_06980 [Thalassotalea sp. 42_200_T64]